MLRGKINKTETIRPKTWKARRGKDQALTTFRVKQKGKGVLNNPIWLRCKGTPCRARFPASSWPWRFHVSVVKGRALGPAKVGRLSVEGELQHAHDVIGSCNRPG